MVYTKFYAISTFYKNIKYMKLKYETKFLQSVKNWIIAQITIGLLFHYLYERTNHRYYTVYPTIQYIVTSKDVIKVQ